MAGAGAGCDGRRWILIRLLPVPEDARLAAGLSGDDRLHHSDVVRLRTPDRAEATAAARSRWPVSCCGASCHRARSTAAWSGCRRWGSGRLQHRHGALGVAGRMDRNARGGLCISGASRRGVSAQRHRTRRQFSQPWSVSARTTQYQNLYVPVCLASVVCRPRFGRRAFPNRRLPRR